MTQIKKETTNYIIEQAVCPICSSANSKQILKGKERLHHSTTSVFGVVKCLDCDLCYTNPRVTEGTIGYFYPEDYHPYLNTAMNEAELNSAIQSHLKKGVYYIPTLSNDKKRVLEIGCATGEFVGYLKQIGWDAYGVEMNKTSAESAMKNYGVNVFNGRFEESKFEPDYFDYVAMWHTMEHVYKPQNVLNEINKIIKPGGQIAISLPRFECLESRIFGRYWYALDLPRHITHFSVSRIKKLFSDSGFSVDEIIFHKNMNNIAGSTLYILDDLIFYRNGTERFSFARKMIQKALTIILRPFRGIYAFFKFTGRMTVVAKKKNL